MSLSEIRSGDWSSDVCSSDLHALIQSCLLQAQLCLNKETKETESYDPFPQASSSVP